MILYIIIGIGVFIFAFTMIKSRDLCIKNPSVKFYDVTGTEFSGILHEDRSAIGELFMRSSICKTFVEPCDVLFFYAHFSKDGKIDGTDLSLREIIKVSTAKIVVVASPNPSSSYNTPAKDRRLVRTNLVLTMDRRGPHFPNFVYALFSKMNSGMPMTTAWTSLAAQKADSVHQNLPVTMFLCELGALRFIKQQ